MVEFFRQPALQALLMFAVVVAAAVFVVYLVTKMRENPDEHGSAASDMLSSFRELHASGKLTDEEYRTIKANLSARLQQELKDSDETG